MISSLFISLIDSLRNVAIEKWKDHSQFKTLRMLAHERISRELFWNLECLASRKRDENGVYLRLLRTEAFDELVKMSAPLDLIFSDQVGCLMGVPCRPLPQILRVRLRGVTRLSRLLDRTYNRIWMLRHRLQHDLPMGDLTYLRQLIKLSHDEVERVRRCLAGEALSGDQGLPPTDLSGPLDGNIW